MLYSSALAYSSENPYSGEVGGDGLAYSSAVEYSSAYDYLGLAQYAGATLTYAQVGMLTDIWQRFGLDPSAPLTETETSASFGSIVLAKSGTDTITSTRTGISASGNVELIILDIWRRLGLDANAPMTAASDSINAGWMAQTITPTAGGVIVTRIDPTYTAPSGYADPDYTENQE